jgi:hypothetical protein
MIHLYLLLVWLGGVLFSLLALGSYGLLRLAFAFTWLAPPPPCVQPGLRDDTGPSGAGEHC